MASRIGVNMGFAGLPTVTAELYEDGSDVLVETVALTEETNRVGLYMGTTTTTETGLYLVGTYTDGDHLGNQWIMLSNASPTGDYSADSRFDAIVRALLPGAWDVETISDGLHMSYSDLYRACGSFLGYGPDPLLWTAEQERAVVDIIRSGLRSFYWPTVDGERYTWSFLRKSATITTVAETGEYALATDFTGRLLGFTHAAGVNQPKLSRVSEDEILAMRGKNDQSGVPVFCAVSAVQPAAAGKTTYQTLLYPRPNAVYTLHYRYAIEPPLTGEALYHLGGAAHSETVLEACLASCEKLRRPELGDGVHYGRFMERVRASITLDKELQ